MNGFRIRPAEERDGGFTLVELLCAMFLFAVVLTIISSATISMTQSLRKQQGQADNLDGARKALELLDSQARYANTITQMGLNSAGTADYIEFQNGNTIAGQQPTQTCYQWRLNTTTSLLQYRSWTVPTTPVPPTGLAVTTINGWQTELTGAVPPTSGLASTFFTNALPYGSPNAQATTLGQRASLTVSFGAKHGRPSTTTQNTATFTALNTTSWATASSGVCAPTTIDAGSYRP